MGGYALTGSLGREPLSDGDSTVPVLQTCASYCIQMIDRLFNCCALGQATEIHAYAME